MKKRAAALLTLTAMLVGLMPLVALGDTEEICADITTPEYWYIKTYVSGAEIPDGAQTEWGPFDEPQEGIEYEGEFREVDEPFTQFGGTYVFVEDDRSTTERIMDGCEVVFSHVKECGEASISVTSNVALAHPNPNFDYWFYGFRASVDGEDTGVSTFGQGAFGTLTLDLEFEDNQGDGEVVVRYWVHASTEWDLVEDDLNIHISGDGTIESAYREFIVKTECTPDDENGENGDNGNGTNGTNGTNGGDENGTNGENGDDNGEASDEEDEIEIDSDADELPFTGIGMLPFAGLALIGLGLLGLLFSRKVRA